MPSNVPPPLSGVAGVAASPAPISFHELLSQHTMLPPEQKIDVEQIKRDRAMSNSSGTYAIATEVANDGGMNPAAAQAQIGDDDDTDTEQKRPAHAPRSPLVHIDSKRQPLIDNTDSV
jgi:hypothetical protein